MINDTCIYKEIWKQHNDNIRRQNAQQSKQPKIETVATVLKLSGLVFCFILQHTLQTQTTENTHTTIFCFFLQKNKRTNKMKQKT